MVKFLCGPALVLLCVVAACAPGAKETPTAGSRMPASVMDPYLKIHDALAVDSLEGIRQHAGEIATAATALGAPAMRIDTSAVQLAAAEDLDGARDRFGALSDAIITYATGLKLAMPDGVRTAFCPMVQKPWLQKGDTLENPYQGKAMPTCGDFR
jgi:uncharacterized membrane protein